jgi:hypothetical protein
LPFPAVTAASPKPAAKTALPPRQTTPPAIARTSSGSKEYQSGLSAAFSGEQQVGGLGALDDAASFTLSSVDGSENSPAPDASAFGPPPEAVAKAPSAPVKAKPAPAPAKPADAPLDMFAPPDAQDDNLSVQLAPDEIERSAKKKVTAPPENVEAPRAARASLQAPNAPAARTSRPSMQPPMTVASTPTGLKDPKTRFIVGVVLAIAIGFIPAHLFASMREKSAFGDIDANVVELQKQVVTPEDYTALDPMRARQLERKHDDRRNIAMLSLLIWAVAGAGVSFVYFKKIAPA